MGSLANYKKLVKKSKEVKKSYQPKVLKANTTYVNQLLDSTFLNRKWKTAVRIFDSLEAKNAHVHFSSYRKILYSVGYRGQQVEKAKEIFEKIQKKSDYKDRFLYNTMIHSYAIKGDYQEAINYYKELKKSVQPNGFTISYLLKAIKKAPKEEQEKLLEPLLDGVYKHLFELKKVKSLLDEIKAPKPQE